MWGKPIKRLNLLLSCRLDLIRHFVYGCQVDRQESVNLICLEFISQVLSFSGFVIGYLAGISRVDFIERQPELVAHSINGLYIVCQAGGPVAF